MEKLSVADAAIKLGISKEAIYNRIRRKTIKSIEEDGVKYVLLGDDKTPTTKTKIQTNSTNNNELVEYLKGEIEYLKLKKQQWKMKELKLSSMLQTISKPTC